MTDATGESEQTSHGDYVPDADEYAADRAEWRRGLAGDQSLRDRAVDAAGGRRRAPVHLPLGVGRGADHPAPRRRDGRCRS